MSRLPGAVPREGLVPGPGREDGRQHRRCRCCRPGGRSYGSFAVTRPCFPPSPGRGSPHRRPGRAARGCGAVGGSSFPWSLASEQQLWLDCYQTLGRANVPWPQASQSARGFSRMLAQHSCSGLTSIGPTATRLSLSLSRCAPCPVDTRVLGFALSLAPVTAQSWHGPPGARSTPATYYSTYLSVCRLPEA